MGFSFSSIGRFFGHIAQETVVVSRKMGTVASALQRAEPTIEGLTSIVSPQAALIERAAFGIFGKVAETVHNAGPAVQAGGFNIALDAQELAEIKDLVQYFKAIGHSQGVAGLVMTAGSLTANTPSNQATSQPVPGFIPTPGYLAPATPPS